MVCLGFQNCLSFHILGDFVTDGNVMLLCVEGLDVWHTQLN